MSYFPLTIISVQNNLNGCQNGKVNNIDCQTVLVSLVLSLNISSATSKRREKGEIIGFLLFGRSSSYLRASTLYSLCVYMEPVASDERLTFGGKVCHICWKRAVNWQLFVAFTQSFDRVFLKIMHIIKFQFIV